MMLFGSVSAILFLSTPSARRATKISNIAFAASSNFYPRPPRGGRLRSVTSPSQPAAISIHALREEGDCTITATTRLRSSFLSTPSARRATLT